MATQQPSGHPALQRQQTYQHFWEWFAAQAAAFHQAIRERTEIETLFFHELAPQLEQVREKIWFMAGMFDSEIAEIIFTSDGDISSIVFIEELVAAAPAIQGWKFTALKQPAPLQDIDLGIEDYHFNRDTISFYANEHPEYPDEIDLTILHPDYTEDRHQVISAGTFLFLDSFLGELEMGTSIDRLSLQATPAPGATPIPVEKLASYLKWRQSEFVEKYGQAHYNTVQDAYAPMNAMMEDGRSLLALVNTGLLQWEGRVSYPWLLILEIRYDDSESAGHPDTQTLDRLEAMEEDFFKELYHACDCADIARQTGAGLRLLYLACKDFREPAKATDNLKRKYAGQFEVNYTIYKDKYWRTLAHFLEAGGAA